MNIKQIQERLDKIATSPRKSKEQRTEERDKLFFKPKPGKYVLRFVPLKNNPDNPFTELYFHYQFGKRTIFSPINYGEKDPIVEFAKNLSTSKDPEDWKLGKKLQPKQRIFAPVLVRGEEEKGIRFYEFGKQIYTDLMTLAADEEVGDFTDVSEGRDMKLVVVQGAQYIESSISPSMKITELDNNAKKVEEYLEQQPTLLDYYEKNTFEQIKKELENFLNPDGEEVKSESEVFPTRNTAFPKKEVVETDEFDELFSEK